MALYQTASMKHRYLNSEKLGAQSCKALPGVAAESAAKAAKLKMRWQQRHRQRSGYRVAINERKSAMLRKRQRVSIKYRSGGE
jgi:hypothetical protein